MSRRVTPCVGVWIEIDIRRSTRVRYEVTPCVGVWIEIRHSLVLLIQMLVTPCVGVWIEIVCVYKSGRIRSGHSLRGSVDWNPAFAASVSKNYRHSLRGSVDWNFSFSFSANQCRVVTPCVGVWIEIIRSRKSLANRWSSLPAWECGLKYVQCIIDIAVVCVTPCVGVWIEIGIQRCSRIRKIVTPCVGVWIRI